MQPRWNVNATSTATNYWDISFPVSCYNWANWYKWDVAVSQWCTSFIITAITTVSCQWGAYFRTDFTAGDAYFKTDFAAWGAYFIFAADFTAEWGTTVSYSSQCCISFIATASHASAQPGTSGDT